MNPSRKKIVSLVRTVGLLTTTAIPMVGADQYPKLVPLGFLATSGDLQSIAYDVSLNGAVVGFSKNQSGFNEAFIRYPSGGLVGLGDFSGGSFGSVANAISEDGSTVVGYGTLQDGVNDGSQAFRWTQSTGLQGIGDLINGSFNSRAFGVSSDGTVVVGDGTSASGIEAFRWKNGVMTGLGDILGGGFSSSGFGVSGDGLVVVGSGIGHSGQQAFRSTVFDVVDSMVGLGDLPGGAFYSEAFGVSHDGTVIVGQSHSANGFEAFSWSEATGMLPLGDKPGGGFASVAYDVTADGRTIVGASSSNLSYATIWRDGLLASLDELLLGMGLSIGGDNWAALLEATAISADGRYVVGSGIRNGNLEAYRLDFGPQPAIPEASAFPAAFIVIGLIAVKSATQHRRSNSFERRSNTHA